MDVLVGRYLERKIGLLCVGFYQSRRLGRRAMKGTLLRTVPVVEFLRKSRGGKIYNIDIYEILGRAQIPMSRSATQNLVSIAHASGRSCTILRQAI